MQTPSPLFATILVVAVLGALAHPVWGQSPGRPGLVARGRPSGS